MTIVSKDILAKEIRGYANAIEATDIPSRIEQHLKDLERLVRGARKALKEVER